MLRKTLAVAVLLAATRLTAGQQPEPPAARYDVAPSLETFPQKTPQEALASVVRAIDRGKADYLAAHLLEPGFADARVNERARPIEPDVEKELAAVRDAQRRNPSAVGRDERLPDDPRAFAVVVQQEAARRAFRLLARDVRTTLTEHPSHAADLRKLLRDGQFVTAGDTATVTHKDLKDRQVTLKAVGGRWYVEDAKEPAGGKK